jgi:hypothetical protein
VTRRLAVLLGLLLLAACGDHVPDGPRVEIWTAPMDGAPPAGLRVRSLAVDQGGKTWPLVRVPSEGERIFAAEGAPDGHYAVESEDGWGMLWQRSEPPDLRRNALEVVALQIGRPNTLYVGRASRDYRFTADWAAERVEVGGKAEPVPLKVDLDENQVPALRFAPGDWRGRIHVIGRLTNGDLTDVIDAEPRRGAEPLLRSGRPAPMRPLRVHVEQADGGGPAKAVVEVRIAGLPLEFHPSEAAASGVATFPALPILGKDLEVGLQGVGRALAYDEDAWRKSRDVRLLLAPAAPVVRRIRAPGPLAEVQALPAGGDAYGIVPVEPAKEDGVSSIRLGAGAYRLLVRVDDRWAEVDLPAGAEEVTVDGADLRPATKVDVSLQKGGSVVRFLRHEADGRRVSGHGFDLAVEGNQAGSMLPPGEYDVVWEREPGEVHHHPSPIPLSPGGQAFLAL